MEVALTRGVKNSKKNTKRKKEGRGPYIYGVFFFPPFISHNKL